MAGTTFDVIALLEMSDLNLLQDVIISKIQTLDGVNRTQTAEYRGEEMSDEIIEGSHSVVWDQGENRMHTEKAVLSLTTM